MRIKVGAQLYNTLDGGKIILWILPRRGKGQEGRGQEGRGLSYVGNP